MFNKTNISVDNDGWNHLEKDASMQHKSVTIPLQSGSLAEYMFGYGGHLSNAKAMKFYQTSSAIATSVDMIADAFEQITPVLKTEDGKLIHDAEVLSLLKNPNGFNTWMDFAGVIARYYLITHDSYITAVGSVKRPPSELWPVAPQNLTTQEAADTYPKSYNVTQGMLKGNFTRQETRKAIRFYANSLSELYHIMGFSSRSVQISGDSPLQAAALEAKQLLAGRTHNLSLLNNGGRLSLLMVFKGLGGNDDEQKEKLQKIKEDITGPENAGTIAMINEADMFDVKEMGANNKDMDYAKLDEFASQAIYLRYNIPLPLVTLKASTFNNMKTANEFFYDKAVLPTADKILGGLSKFLLPRYGLDPSKVQITYDRESIQALKQRQLDELEQRGKIGIETDNELRSFLVNREPYEGGDNHYKPATLVVVGEDLFTEPEPDTGLEGDEDE